MAKADYQLLADTFGDSSPVVPKYRTLRIRLQEIALRNHGMLEREGKGWLLWVVDQGEWIEPNLQEVEEVMRGLWPHEFLLDNVKLF